MLTKKELEYVNVPSSQAPYPGVAYAKNVAEKLLQAYQLYKDIYQGKEYDIIMSNGETLSLEIQKKNLCHMLGIDFKNVASMINEELKNSGGVRDYQSFSGSFQVLEYIIDRLDEILDHDNKSKQRYLNYFKVMVKSTILMSFSDFTSFDFGIINFNKENYKENSNKRFNSNATKLLFTPSNELVMPHYIMGLRQDSNEEILEKNIVETMYASPNVADFMDNQTLLIPTQILITDSNSEELTKISASSKEKIEILRMYQSLISKNQITANIDILADYESMLIENTLTRKI